VATVDATLVERFETQGAVAVPGLFDAGWIASLRAAVDEILELARDRAELLGPTRGLARSSHGMWRESDAFARFLHDSPIAATAGAAMRSDTVVLYEDLFLFTGPGVEGASWHRDSPHWPVRGHQLSSVWFSLEPVTPDTGALRFVAGSHLDEDELVRSEGLSVALDRDAGGREVICFDSEPGDAVVFHPRVLHAAFGAATDRPRRTFTIRFAGDDVRWRPRSNYYHPWMRDAGLHRDDPLDHMWFPVLRRTTIDAAVAAPPGQPVAR
jgi:ectoine hydroxylase-related dioxygenase (phytanoyl-CoA dioxygenase family)